MKRVLPLIAAALLHSAIVVEKREVLKSWTILLAIIAFGFSLIGTFIVRSGVITSVHSFASDPTRGIFILAILATFVGGALTLYAARAGSMTARGVFAPVSREGALLLNNLLFAVAAFVVFIGTIWPLLSEMFFDRTLSVGPPFFNAAFSPFVFVLAVALPIGSVMPWKRASIGRAMRQQMPAALLAGAGAMGVAGCYGREEPPAEARRLVGEAAQALEGARRHGVHHEALDPELLLRDADGGVLVKGLGIAAALTGADTGGAAAAAERDTKDLVALLRAGLTGRWPAAGRPSEVAEAVPYELDELCAQLDHEGSLELDGEPVRTPGDLVSVLAPWNSGTVSGRGVVRPAPAPQGQ